MGNVWADTTVSAPIPVPVLQQRVTDLTNTLNSTQIADLAQKLAAFEQQKGTQLAVLLVPTTQPESIEQYSIRVVEQWNLGRKQVDDGVLLLIAKNDHQVRIEVGRGLEGRLTDVESKHIIEEMLVPTFQRDQYAAGIETAVLRIITLINQEALPPVQPANASTTEWVLAGLLTLLTLLFFPLVVLIKMASLIYTLKYGQKLRYAPFLQDHAILRGIVIFGESVRLQSGGRSGSSGGGGFSGGGGGFGGGGASGRW